MNTKNHLDFDRLLVRSFLAVLESQIASVLFERTGRRHGAHYRQ